MSESVNWSGGLLAALLALPGVTGIPGARLAIPVAFTSQTGPVAGLQFDVQCESAAISLSAAAGEAMLASEKSLYQAGPSLNLRRILVAGPNRNPIPNGTLVHLLVYLNPGIPAGSYPISFSNIVATDGDGMPLSTSGVNGTVRVAQAAGGVVNGASLLPGPVAPGEVVRLLTAAPVPAGTTVLFDGVATPLLNAEAGAVVTVVPPAAAGKEQTRVQVVSGGRVSAEFSVPVTAAAPGIFTLDSSGIGPGAVLNQDWSVNSPANPAARGSLALLVATGTGGPVAVRIGLSEAEVRFAGPAPAGAGGVDLVVCRIPENAPAGPALPVIIRAGSATSQPGVTLAVR